MEGAALPSLNSVQASSQRRHPTHLVGSPMTRPFACSVEPRECLGLEEATSLIKAAGGVAVIAHPISLGLRGPALRAHVAACKDRGVSGIEAWHPNQPLKECRRYERLGRSLGMIVTGGSDFHGEHIPQRMLGRSAGGREIPDSFLDALPLHPPAA